jgi:hypothetical protein
VLDELDTMGKRGLAVVPTRISAPSGKTIAGVIVTDNRGHRFRILEAAGKWSLEEDQSPRERTPAWRRLESGQAMLRSTLLAMLDVMND